MPLGIYISVPFCKMKCSYCNFASDVFSKSAYENYVRRVIDDIEDSRTKALRLGCILDAGADSIYLGGGGPADPDIMRGVAMLNGRQVRVRATSTYIANPTDQALPEQALQGRVNALCQAFAFWAARRMRL